MPQFLANDARFRALPARGRCVCVTQPRRVAAVSIATRLAEEMGVKLGAQVGYAVRWEEKCAPDALIRVVTDGMLLREAMVDPQLRRYSVVVLDEAHERTVQTDLLVSLLKRIQRDGKRKTPLRIVIMSATLSPAVFLGYFGLDDSAVLYVEGRQFSVKVYYTRAPVEDVLDAAVQAVMTIHQGSRAGDVLVFLDGQEAIEAMMALLGERNKTLPHNPMMVLPLYAALPARYQMRVFEAYPGHRKVIVATNIAETSLTIPGVVFVVDSCKHKVRTFNGLKGISKLQR